MEHSCYLSGTFCKYAREKLDGVRVVRLGLVFKENMLSYIGFQVLRSIPGICQELSVRETGWGRDGVGSGFQ